MIGRIDCQKLLSYVVSVFSLHNFMRTSLTHIKEAINTPESW